jgi:hypothetical protein
MKTRANEIRSARYLSRAPVVISVAFTTGGSDAYNLHQIYYGMTPGAQKKAYRLAEEGLLSSTRLKTD